MIPNTLPDCQVRVIPGTVGVAGVAVAQLLGRDAVVARFHAGSGWSVQALLDYDAFFSPSVFHFFQTKTLFSQTSSQFPHFSDKFSQYCHEKNPNTGAHTLNAGVCFMTYQSYPKVKGLNFEMSCGEKERGSWEHAPFDRLLSGKRKKTLGKKFHF